MVSACTMLIQIQAPDTELLFTAKPEHSSRHVRAFAWVLHGDSMLTPDLSKCPRAAWRAPTPWPCPADPPGRISPGELHLLLCCFCDSSTLIPQIQRHWSLDFCDGGLRDVVRASPSFTGVPITDLGRPVPLESILALVTIISPTICFDPLSFPSQRLARALLARTRRWRSLAISRATDRKSVV